jgi:uncharacterized protein (DUF302 family)
MSYHISRTVNLSFDNALGRLEEELKKEGFGILTEIDVKNTLKKKLGVEFRRYTILGACNPLFARKALELEDRIGVALPCNVVVQEHEGGRVEVSAMDPVVMMKSIGNPGLLEIAGQVQGKLKTVIESL